MKRKMKKERMNLPYWFKNHDLDNNFFFPSMDAQTAVFFLRDYLLGEDYRIPYPAGTEEANTVIVLDILDRYSARFIKEIRAEGR